MTKDMLHGCGATPTLKWWLVLHHSPPKKGRPKISLSQCHIASLLVVSTPLKKISQNGNLPQIGMNIKNIWNHQPARWVLCQVNVGFLTPLTGLPELHLYPSAQGSPYGNVYRVSYHYYRFAVVIIQLLRQQTTGETKNNMCSYNKYIYICR